MKEWGSYKMKKYVALCFSIAMQTFSILEAGAAMGPIPLPSQFYQTNPAFKMTPKEKTAVSQAFSWAQQMVGRNHTYLCQNRGTCLNMDLKTLASFINSRPTHPARAMFQDLYNIIRHDARHQKFVTQWVIFSNLSPKRQKEYRQGIRVTPIQPHSVRLRSGAIAPAHFNQDDVFTDLLEAVDHSHKNCDEYISCLSTDLQIIKYFHDRLSPTDPVRVSLKKLGQITKNLSDRKIFNTNFYLTLYNPLGADWNNTLKKHKAKDVAAYGYAEWRQVERRSSRAVRWLAPRITNGVPLQPMQPKTSFPKKSSPW